MDEIRVGDMIVAPIGEHMSEHGEVVGSITPAPTPDSPSRHRIVFARRHPGQLDEDLVHHASDGYPIVIDR